MGCIAIQLLCPRHGQAERADAWAQGLAARALGMRPGCAVGQQAVHLVHSAYF